MKDCIFCNISSGSVKEDKIIDTENFIAVNDIYPKAPVHILIIPKRHIEKPEEFNTKELSELFTLGATIAAKKGVSKDGYRLVFNVGKKAGQEIDHVHMHLLGGVQSKALY